MGNKVFAIYRHQNGFSDVDAMDLEVQIMGYVWGKHEGEGMYDSKHECTLAICYSDKLGGFKSVPISSLIRIKA